MRTLVAFALLLPQILAAAAPAGWVTRTEATASWDSNIANANLETDIVGALLLKARADAARRVSLRPGEGLITTFGAGIESVPRYNGLDQARADLDVAWQHKFGLGAFAPTFGIHGGAGLIGARESGRAGWTGTTGITWNKRLDEVTQSALAAHWDWEDAVESVFDRSAFELSMRVDRDLGEKWRTTFESFYRSGDVVSSATPPRPDLVALAPKRLSIDTFGPVRTAYSIDGKTWSGSLGLSRVLSPTTLATLTYQYRETQSGRLRYLNHLVSAAWVRQF